MFETLGLSQRVLFSGALVVAIALEYLQPLTLAYGQEKLRVGVWNIERLSATAKRGFPELRGSDSLPPRSNEDLEKLAKYIRDDLKVDALMVTEIEADAPESTEFKPQSKQLNQVAETMGSNWKYFLSRSGDKMRLGLLFNTERVTLKKLVNLNAPEFRVSGKDVLDRDPFIVWIAQKASVGSEQKDVLLICVHLKSQQGPFRNNRMAAIAKLIGDFTDREVRQALTLPSATEEPEAIILGDCNDSTFADAGFKYMFDYLTCAACHTSKLSFGGKEYWIDGSQAMTDVQSWLNELVRAMQLTLKDAADAIRSGLVSGTGLRLSLDQNTKFGRFVRRLTGTIQPTITQAKVIYDTLEKDFVRRQRYDDYNEFGRAFGSSDPGTRSGGSETTSPTQ